MGGLIALFLISVSFLLGAYFVLRKLIFRKKIPHDIANDDLIGGALNLGIYMISFVFFVYLIVALIPIEKMWLRNICMFISLYLCYLIVKFISNVMSKDE